MFKIDPNTGYLTPNGTVSTGQEPFCVVVYPSASFVYVANESGSVSIYSLGSEGLLSSAGMTETGGAALSVAVTGTKQ
jgi:DNA-binding beta-propeller fold protein YncE